MHDYLTNKEYSKIQNPGQEMEETWRMHIWMRESEAKLWVIYALEENLPGQKEVPLEESLDRMEAVTRRLMLVKGKPTQDLMLLVRQDMPDEKMVELLSTSPKIWHTDLRDGRVFLYEAQSDRFGEIRADDVEDLIRTYKGAKEKQNRNELVKTFTPVNTTLVLINIFVFLLDWFLSASGVRVSFDDLFAMNYHAIVENGEYYRLFTAMFIHFGIYHLSQNMLILVVIGSRMERILGRLRYLVLYLVSGLGASLTSLYFTLAPNPGTMAAGASGAIFGVMGSMLAVVLSELVSKRRRRTQEIGMIGIIFMIGAALSYGFTSTGVDNAAHIGGLVCGFLLTMVYSLLQAF